MSSSALYGGKARPTSARTGPRPLAQYCLPRVDTKAGSYFTLSLDGVFYRPHQRPGCPGCSLPVSWGLMEESS